MNSVLSYIAGFVVLVLFAALVGPSFVDWNNFRDDVEERLSDMTGWKAQVSGDINFVILPAPRFKLNGVRFSLPDDDAHTLAEMGTVEGEVALAPLLGGNIEVTRVRVADFAIAVSVDEDGRSDWPGVFNGAGASSAGYFDAKSIRLEDVRLERGSFVYRDARNGRQVSFSEIAGTFHAASLSGPMRADLSFRQGGQKARAEMALGEFGGTRAFPFSTTLSFDRERARASFSGIITEFSHRGRLDGAVQASAGRDANGDPLIRLDGGLVAGQGEATMRTLNLTLPGSALSGGATFNWRSDPRGRIRLAGQSLDLGALVNGTGAATALDALLDRLPSDMLLEAELEADNVLFDGRSAKALKARVTRSGEGWELQESALDLAHGAQLQLSGKQTGMTQGGTRYDSRFEITAPNARLLANWLAGEGAPASSSGGAAVPLELSGAAALTDRLWRFYNLELALGTEEPNLRGGFSMARAERPVIGIEAHGADADLSPLAPLLTLLPGTPHDVVEAYDVHAVLSGSNLAFDGWRASVLDLDASLRGGALSVERASVADESGAQLSVSGRLADVTEEPSGALQGRLDAANPDTTLFGLLDESWPRATFTPLSIHFEIQGAADDDGGHSAALDLTGRAAESSLTGAVKRRRAAGNGEAAYEGVISLANAEGAALLAQLGSTPAESVSGSGEARLQFSGSAAQGYDASLRLAANGADASMKGRAGGTLSPLPEEFDGRFDVSAPQLEAIVDALGLADGDAQSLMRLLLKNGGRGGVLAGGALKRGGGLWSFSDVEAVAGTFRISGDFDWREAEDGGAALPHLSGMLEASRLTLDPVLSQGVAPGDMWPTAPLDWRVLGQFTADVGFRADRMSLAGIFVEDAESHVAVEDGVLSVSPFKAAFAGSRLTLGARFEGGAAEPGLGLKLSIEQADLAQASALAFGKPAGQGTLALDMQAEGKGRSWLALVSSLSGSGRFSAESGHFNGFDLGAFTAGLTDMQETEDFAALKDTALEEGETPFTRFAADLVLEEGLVQSETLDLVMPDSPGASGKLYADTARLRGDVELVLPLAAPENAPPLGFVSAGPLRDMRGRFDAGAVERFIARQLLARQMEEAGVETLPEELEELIGAPPARNQNAPAEEMQGGEALEAPTPLQRPRRAS